jgi:hypothetical protein
MPLRWDYYCAAIGARPEVQYAIGGMDHQLFVSRYLVALPSEERLREWIETDRAAIDSPGFS